MIPALERVTQKWVPVLEKMTRINKAIARRNESNASRQALVVRLQHLHPVATLRFANLGNKRTSRACHPKVGIGFGKNDTHKLRDSVTKLFQRFAISAGKLLNLVEILILTVGKRRSCKWGLNVKFIPLGLALIVGLLVPLTPVMAVEPNEVLEDLMLEARARDLSSILRCMVCQNQSIDDSDAELARDLRVLVRKRLTAGDSDKQVLDYLVARYGEFVLLKPRLNIRTAMLWSLPVIVLLAAAAMAYAGWHRRRTVAPAAPLTADESARLKAILRESDR